jgi:endonuclease/exonuclease/phosphatase family metal-dependent hydrolase
MILTGYVLLVALMFTSHALSQNDQQIIKVMTFNIRCAACEKESDVNHWSKRKNLVAQLIIKYIPDIIGLQEAEKIQIEDLMNLLKGYNWFGAGRDDGKETGELTAVFYKEDRFILREQSTLWLSVTPDIPSKGWDAAFNRTLTKARIEDKLTGKNFHFFNTHFDHKGEFARTESAKLILNEVQKVSNDFPVVLTGDLNAIPTSEPYKLLIKDQILFDANEISEKPHYGGIVTFNGFGKIMGLGNTIDYIFVNDKVDVLSHGVITDTFDERYPSDHYPVIAEIIFK